MRVGTTLLFKDGYCYQSYGWNMLRPLGALQNALDHLDKYELDEIAIIRPVRDNDYNYNNDIQLLKNAKSSTPLAFGGGIRSLDDIEILEGLPVERFILSSVLFDKDLSVIPRLHSKYGEQSIIGFIPFSFKNQFEVFNSRKNCFQSPLSINESALKLCDEVVLHDCDAEGRNIGFNVGVLDNLEINSTNLIFSGGVSEMVRNRESIETEPKSILIDNKILHRENSKKTYYGAM
jgi:phosphoribosylformimino-5-aminoimidazole carboxamide ribonucleotide (ProFAR) isomerase